MVKILDCTLRDGGYINDWNFGYDSIKKIYNNLLNSKIDYIEAGFLRDTNYNKNFTLYNDISNLNFLNKKNNVKLCAMIMSGEFDISKIVPKSNKIKLDCIRYVFKKNQIKIGLYEAQKIKEKGYELSINPSNIDTYSENEFLNIIKCVNRIKPEIFCMVDTKGVLREKDLPVLNKIVEENLDDKIVLGFHSHNNLQLSFSNAQFLIKNTSRKLIIDSSIFGMGRGAGNLSSELLTKYLNENYGGKYEVVPILETIEEIINPIFKKTPWGYSVPYYLAALNNCHPNYAKYLIERKNVSVDMINKLLYSIPQAKKTLYDKDFIEKVYSCKFNNKVLLNQAKQSI